MQLTGSCYCRAIEYKIELASADEARTSLCHCKNCKKAFGTNFGLTTKIPWSSFAYTKGSARAHTADNGSGTELTREFCGGCGSFILEFGEPARGRFRYVAAGSLDRPEEVPAPKGEFFCSARAAWMPELPGVFHKERITE